MERRMYKLSGNLQQNAVICVYKTSDGSLLKRESLTAGDYEIKYLESNNVFAVAVKSDGQGVVYGDVDLIRRGTEVVADTFPGTSLDTGKWTAYTELAGTVATDNELRLFTGPGDLHCGAHVKAVQTVSKTGVIEVSCQWQPKATIGIDYAMGSAVVFVNHSTTSRDANYGSRTADYVTVNFRGYTTNQRRLCIHAPSYSNTIVQDNVGGIQFNNALRSLLVRLTCSTRQLYVNLDNGFRTGTVTLSTTAFDALGSTMDIELSSSDYITEGSAVYDTVRNFSLWTES